MLCCVGFRAIVDCADDYGSCPMWNHCVCVLQVSFLCRIIVCVTGIAPCGIIVCVCYGSRPM
jgi:hypothetical protein